MIEICRILKEPTTGVDPNAVSRWERGVTIPSLFNMRLLCLSFDKAPEQLGFPARPTLVRDLETSRARLRAIRPSPPATATSETEPVDHIRGSAEPTTSLSDYQAQQLHARVTGSPSGAANELLLMLLRHNGTTTLHLKVGDHLVGVAVTQEDHGHTIIDTRAVPHLLEPALPDEAGDGTDHPNPETPITRRSEEPQQQERRQGYGEGGDLSS